jgi:hypothetical protein
MNNEIENLIEKRMKTIMIGSLARFEENFDYLWNEATTQADKQYFLDLWQKTRQEILDYGNNQIRLAKKDIGNLDHGPCKYKYRYKFNMRRDDQ